MYLYKNQDGYLEIHKIKASRRLKDYKEDEINKIPFEKRVMDIETNDYSSKSENLENAIDVISYYKFVYDYYDRDFHTSEYSRIDGINEYSSSKEIENAKKVLNNYFHEKNSCGKVLEVNNSKDLMIKYLLLTEPFYSHCSRDSYMRNIICLPRSLYLLELFLQERFDTLKDEEIMEILKLFDDEGLVKKMNYEEIKELRDYDLISKKQFKKIERGIEKSEKVLSLLNK